MVTRIGGGFQARPVLHGVAIRSNRDTTKGCAITWQDKKMSVTDSRGGSFKLKKRMRPNSFLPLQSKPYLSQCFDGFRSGILAYRKTSWPMHFPVSIQSDRVQCQNCSMNHVNFYDKICWVIKLDFERKSTRFKITLVVEKLEHNWSESSKVKDWH